MEAFNEINDKYIVKYAQMKPIVNKKKVFKRLSVIAASVLIVFVTTVLIQNTTISNDPINPVEPDYPNMFGTMQYVLFNGNKYEVLIGEFSITNHKLPQVITQDLIGKDLGQGHLESDGQILTIYDYTGYDGNSILITKLNSEFYYLSFWGTSEPNKILTISELFDLYGIGVNAKIKYNNIFFGGDNLETLINELKKSTALSENDFNDISLDDTSIMDCSEIIITDANTEELILYYYPLIGYAYNGFSYYQLTTEANSILNERN